MSKVFCYESGFCEVLNPIKVFIVLGILLCLAVSLANHAEIHASTVAPATCDVNVGQRDFGAHQKAQQFSTNDSSDPLLNRLKEIWPMMDSQSREQVVGFAEDTILLAEVDM